MLLGLTNQKLSGATKQVFSQLVPVKKICPSLQPERRSKRTWGIRRQSRKPVSISRAGRCALLGLDSKPAAQRQGPAGTCDRCGFIKQKSTLVVKSAETLHQPFSAHLVLVSCWARGVESVVYRYTSVPPVVDSQPWPVFQRGHHESRYGALASKDPIGGECVHTYLPLVPPSHREVLLTSIHTPLTTWTSPIPPTLSPSGVRSRRHHSGQAGQGKGQADADDASWRAASDHPIQSQCPSLDGCRQTDTYPRFGQSRCVWCAIKTQRDPSGRRLGYQS